MSPLTPSTEQCEDFEGSMEEYEGIVGEWDDEEQGFLITLDDGASLYAILLICCR